MAASKSEAGQGGGSQSPVAGPSGQQAGDYAARIALARVQYPCHNCGVMGHWNKDNQCKPADVAAHIRKRMAEQAEADREDREDTGMNLYTFSNYMRSIRLKFSMAILLRKNFFILIRSKCIYIW